jgi:hypothetical protein
MLILAAALEHAQAMAMQLTLRHERIFPVGRGLQQHGRLSGAELRICRRRNEHLSLLPVTATMRGVIPHGGLSAAKGMFLRHAWRSATTRNQSLQ